MEDLTDIPEGFKSGFISVIGKPNVGKSTLLNALLTKKIAPVARKPQTTRQVVHGIRNEEDAQMIFIDTPGIHTPKDELGKRMNSQATKAIGEADLIYFLVESRLPDHDSEEVLKKHIDFKVPIFLLVNKIDMLKDKQSMLPVMEHYSKLYKFNEIIPISALHKTQLDVLCQKTKDYLEKGPRYFPQDLICNQPFSEIIKELIREKVVRLTGEELPYVTAVGVDQFETREDGMVDVQATVYVDKDSQKAILIGKRGEKIKKIGQDARRDLERLLETKVFLGLWVKVLKGWKRDPDRLRELGYED